MSNVAPQPFRSLTSDNPLCSLPDGGMSAPLEALSTQSRFVKDLIEAGGRVIGDCKDGVGEVHIATFVLNEPLFSEVHNILANKGYDVSLKRDQHGTHVWIEWITLKSK